MEYCAIILLLLAFHTIYEPPITSDGYSTDSDSQYELADLQTESTAGCVQVPGGKLPEFSFIQPIEKCDVTMDEARLGSKAPVQPECNGTGGQDTSTSDFFNIIYVAVITVFKGVGTLLLLLLTICCVVAALETCKSYILPLSVNRLFRYASGPKMPAVISLDSITIQKV
ncbi:uncharacterized protein LOC126299215 [Schistocerca gregaria]|uniref:uncharacterized protein LOC126299215 n=1 Tax=Schistocerca gregaria TaxID=7010 RepID=UPI00211ED376|nr:uncharacterized protein LOC126299215 [Schistocerca gregaria]